MAHLLENANLCVHQRSKYHLFCGPHFLEILHVMLYAISDFIFIKRLFACVSKEIKHIPKKKRFTKSFLRNISDT